MEERSRPFYCVFENEDIKIQVILTRKFEEISINEIITTLKNMLSQVSERKGPTECYPYAYQIAKPNAKFPWEPYVPGRDEVVVNGMTFRVKDWRK